MGEAQIIGDNHFLNLNLPRKLKRKTAPDAHYRSLIFDGSRSRLLDIL